MIGGSIWRSTNGGRSWAAFGSVSGLGEIYCIEGDRRVAGRFYVGCANGFYVLDNAFTTGAASFVRDTSVSGACRRIRNFDVGGVVNIWACFDNAGLYRKVGSAAWAQKHALGGQNMFDVHPDQVHVLHYNNVADSAYATTNGSTWFKCGQVASKPGWDFSWLAYVWMYDGLGWCSYDPANANRILVHNSAAMSASDDGGTTFHDSSTGFLGYSPQWFWNGTRYFHLADTKKYAMGFHDVGAMFTKDGGNSYKGVAPAFPRGNYTDSPAAGQVGWYNVVGIAWPADAWPGNTDFPTKYIFAAGAGWSKKLIRVVNGVQTLIDQNISCYAGGWHKDNNQICWFGSLRSVNGGMTFVNLGADFMGVFPGNNNIIFGMRSGNQIVRSTDAGATWAQASATISLTTAGGLPIFGLHPGNSNIVYGRGSNGDLAKYDFSNPGAGWVNMGVLALAGTAGQPAQMNAIMGVLP